MRRVGLVGAGILLLLAVGALAPIAAQADTFFITGQYPATVHGSVARGTQTISTEGGKVECAISYHHEAKAISPSLPLVPTFSSCQAFGFLSATVTASGCTFDLRYPGKVAEDSFNSTFDISCEAGNAVKVTAGTCVMEIGPQSNLNYVTLANDTEASPKRDITFDPEVSSLSYKVTTDGFGCPFSGTGTKTGATFTGSAATLTAQDPSNAETKLELEVKAADTFFITGQYPATVHGSAALGAQNITMEGGKVECAISYHHEAKAISPSLPLVPTFSSCKAFGFLSAIVTTNGCTFDLRLPGKIGEDSFTSTFDISCEAGKAIEVSAGTCKVEIAPQSSLNYVTLTNDTEASPKRDITFDPEVTGIAYKVTTDGFGCPFSGTGAKTGATFTGSAATLTAQDPSNAETKLDLEVG